MSREDKADLVEITLHPITVQFDNQTYPAPTREDIANKVREVLDENKFSYSEKRYPQGWTENNKEPVSSNLETFGDISEILLNNHYENNDEYAKQHEHKDTLGRDSNEQGGNRNKNSYSKDRDPLNE